VGGAWGGGGTIQKACGRLARWRAEAVAAALVQRGVPFKRIVATAPGYDLGMVPGGGQLTIHELPDALHGEAEGGLHASGEAPDYDGLDSRVALSEAEEEEALNHPILTLDDAAALARRQRHELGAASARAELLELQAYAASMPVMQLAAPITLVVSVVDISCYAAKVSTSCVALASERVYGRVAAFEVADLTVDDLEIEVWSAHAASAHASSGDSETAVHPLPPPEPEALIGGGTVSVLSLLLGEAASFAGALPLSDAAGVVVGTARILVEARELAPSGWGP
jgi:hypothetical protein